MNITFSVDKLVAQRVRAAAQKMGKSLNQVVCDYREQLASGARHGQQWVQFEERCLKSGVTPASSQFNRDKTNQR